MRWATFSAVRGPLRCKRLEAVRAAAPYARRLLLRLGVRGLQVGCSGRLYGSCVNLDACRLMDERERSTRRGRVFRVNRRFYFIEHDVTKGLPFAPQSLDFVYAEHFIEHISPVEAIAWLKEVKRALRPGGLLRLTTPDLRLYVRGYLDSRGWFFARHRKQMLAMGCPPMETRKAWMVNQIFRFWGHQWIYDFEELAYVVAEAGFPRDSLRRCGFRRGSDRRVYSLDFDLRRDETIYVEARSPSR